MPIYFFHVIDSATQHYWISACSPSAAQALREGGEAAWLLMSSSSRRGQDWSNWRVEVSDGSGRTILVLPLAFLLRGYRNFRNTTSQRAEAWG